VFGWLKRRRRDEASEDEAACPDDRHAHDSSCGGNAPAEAASSEWDPAREEFAADGDVRDETVDLVSDYGPVDDDAAEQPGDDDARYDDGARYDDEVEGKIAVDVKSKKKPPPPPARKPTILETITIILQNILRGVVALAIMLLLFAALAGGGYLAGKRAKECPTAGCGPDGEKMGEPVNWTVVEKWLAHSSEAHVADMRAKARINALSPFDNMLLGIYERDVAGDRAAAHAQFNLAASVGHPYARTLRNNLDLSVDERRSALRAFEDAHLGSGGAGFFRLGMFYLGDRIFQIDDKLESRIDFCAPNDFLEEPVIDRSYVYFQLAALCDYSEAYDWRARVADEYNFTADKIRELDREARKLMQSGLAGANGDREAFCAPPSSPRRANMSAVPGGVFPADRRQAPANTGSQIYRERAGAAPTPAASASEPDPQAALGASVCARDVEGRCGEARTALANADVARYYLRLGDAELAVGRIDQARDYYQLAVEAGRKYGAQAGLDAARRLSALNLTCEYDAVSIERISNYRAPLSEAEPDAGDDGRELISLTARQRALKALEHYNGNIDGKYGPMTSEAVRSFQREFGFDETGALTPVETVALVCHAAQTARDVESQNLLGVMYAAGLGVVQSTDLSLEWLERASRRGDADAAYNLAILYGTGTVLSSYRLCNIPQSPERADSYLTQAVDRGHPVAKKIIARFRDMSPNGELTAAQRWSRITEVLDLPPQLLPAGDGCPPPTPAVAAPERRDP